MEEDKKELEKNLYAIPAFTQRFKTGTMFYASYLDTHFIYLFTLNKQDYGFYEDEPDRLVKTKELRFYTNTKNIYEFNALIDSLDCMAYLDEDSNATEIIASYIETKLLLKNNEDD